MSRRTEEEQDDWEDGNVTESEHTVGRSRAMPDLLVRKDLMGGRAKSDKSSRKDEKHFIDPQTHFIIELLMICMPFLESQPESFTIAYESIINGREE